jgi:uncharacterized iron-regulated membrane protein
MARIRSTPGHLTSGSRIAQVEPMKILGIVLIVAGLLALAFGGFSWTERDKVVDLGPIQAERQEKHTLPLPPIFGGVAVAAGVILLVVGAKNRA